MNTQPQATYRWRCRILSEYNTIRVKLYEDDQLGYTKNVAMIPTMYALWQASYLTEDVST